MLEPKSMPRSLRLNPQDALGVAQARRRILERVQPVSGEERVDLQQGLGRVLASDVYSTRPVPGSHNSAMDGYAVRCEDTTGKAGGVRLRLVGRSLAGHPYDGTLLPGECVRIATGALLPDGSDTVVAQEQTVRDGDWLTVPGNCPFGRHVRVPGQDIAMGGRVLNAGRALRPADLGLLASVGLAEANVLRRPRVAYFTTGDELQEPGRALAPGQHYERNRLVLGAMLKELGVIGKDFGIVADDREAIRRTLHAASACDAILTSGGVSVGDTDYVRGVVGELGRVDIWRVAVRPGGPLTFASVGRAAFFGLPGNPVSAMVAFTLLVRPALERMMGREPSTPLTLLARVAEPLRKAPGRTDYQRGQLYRDEIGAWSVRSVGSQDSSNLSSMSRADCFIVLPQGRGDVGIGEDVEVMPFPDWV